MYPNTKISSFDFIVNNRFNIADTICKLDTGIKSISKVVVDKEYLPEDFKKGILKQILLRFKTKLIDDKVGRIGFSDGINLFQIKLNEKKMI